MIPPTDRCAKLAAILVVDDDRDTAESMACLLRYFGHEVQIAFDGHQAIEVARRQRPRYVLLDIGLPGLNGYEVAARLRRELPGPLELIAITGFGRDEDRQRAQACGFDGFFLKPFDQDAFDSLMALLQGETIGPPTSPAPIVGEAAGAPPATAVASGNGQAGGDLHPRESAQPEVAGGNGRPNAWAWREVELGNASGLHLRAAVKIVRLATQYQADVQLSCDGRRVDGRSIIDLMTLGAECGTRLELEAGGPDAEAALAELAGLIERGFDEPEG
jgi:phosphotransferase system HPr (HPr) family protein